MNSLYFTSIIHYNMFIECYVYVSLWDLSSFKIYFLCDKIKVIFIINSINTDLSEDESLCINIIL